MRHSSELVAPDALDPLLRGISLPYTRVHYPFGFALELRTNSEEILDAAEKSWGQFHQEHPFAPLQLQVGVAGDDDGPVPPSPAFRAVRHMLTVTGDSENFGVADFSAGFSFCWLTPRLLQDMEAVRYFYVESMGSCLISERYLAGVHGACVARNGKGVLLCGDSQAGKSTLAYACARRGFTYVSDDASFLIRESHSRKVTGNCHSIRFRPSAVDLFPELEQFLPSKRANGKIAIEVQSRKLQIPSKASNCEAKCLVFLRRTPGHAAQLLPFSRKEALDQMRLAFPFGRDESIREQSAAVEQLLDSDVYELVYCDLNEAVDCLEMLLT